MHVNVRTNPAGGPAGPPQFTLTRSGTFAVAVGGGYVLGAPPDFASGPMEFVIDYVRVCGMPAGGGINFEC